MRMANLTKLISLLGLGLLYFQSCSERESADGIEPASRPPSPAQPKLPDLSEVVEKRMEGNTTEAITMLREYNRDFPESHAILVQLARALGETDQYALASFRFDQAIAAGAPQQALKEAAEAYAYANDYHTSAKRYADYLLVEEDDRQAWLKYGRVLARIQQTTDAINAFSKGADLLTFEDCLLVGNLFASKKLLQQAEYWYNEAALKKDTSSEPLVQLLRLKIDNQEKEEEAESLILKIEEKNSGILEKTDLAEKCANLVRRRKIGEFIRKGISPSGLSITKLISVLKQPVQSPLERIIAKGPKLPPSRPTQTDSFLPPEEDHNSLLDPEIKNTENSVSQGTSLANAFATPPQDQTYLPLKSNIEKARIAYLDRKYQETLLSARAALKENPKSADAWKLCSQAHFQIGETQEAEMTILEAIRHDPTSLDIRMDYLRIARETLSPNRYLAELEKAREIFPESSDLVWELARRYHLVERMPVTAGILYRKVLELEPEGSALARQAEMEILKLRE